MKLHLSSASVLAPVLVLGLVGFVREAHAQDAAEGRRWKQHEMNRPRPQPVAPVQVNLPVPPPPDAVVLFGGNDLSKWQQTNGSAARWKVENGYFEVQPGTGAIRTKEEFGDAQVHVEWASPNPPKGTGQDRGNSGVFLMGRYEVQVLDSHQANTYADGQAGAIYGQYPPLFNATRAPGEWNAYDIFFRRPRFAPNGSVVEPARITVLHNGILVQNNEVIRGLTTWLKSAPYQAHGDQGPIELQDHGHPVRFRNIWVRRIPARAEPDATYGAADRPIKMPSARLDRYVGAYGRPGGFSVTITRTGNELFAQMAGQSQKIVPVSETEFVTTDTAGRLVFVLDAQDRPTGVTFHMGGAQMQAPRAK